MQQIEYFLKQVTDLTDKEELGGFDTYGSDSMGVNDAVRKICLDVRVAFVERRYGASRYAPAPCSRLD
jgi:hypothetical protein